ncbi:DUF695 domain-containing protein [Sphingomonas sanxanigenens]|uniref:DUF695 domain-containing protein n=1 Tax=Sphingomonas sanxanigenens DSM 19645 = NX02 TaxID=1123269 RepID=W0APF5_9SPHN|nr:DUF695 domain-containing protein [Sphingomonas sanxanigenens]AHE57500.1 hypothetical protein NX02_29695 [Sphingomonas sanxanigenens DSM 19645 = NX02]
MANIYNDDNWSLVTASNGAHNIVIRCRSRLPAEPDREIFKFVVQISWPYGPTDTGHPDDATRSEIEAFEDIFLEPLASKLCAVEVASITGNDQRDWLFHTYDPREFSLEFNAILRDRPKYPISMECYEDEDWATLSRLLPSQGRTGR